MPKVIGNRFTRRSRLRSSRASSHAWRKFLVPLQGSVKPSSWSSLGFMTTVVPVATLIGLSMQMRKLSRERSPPSYRASTTVLCRRQRVKLTNNGFWKKDSRNPLRVKLGAIGAARRTSSRCTH
ncbi:unnamed protein product [Symbiodinium necroappetens]|uniref:Uncharacterized protein n=1 Tax=Symbiodinium necroappetens TaxID=1628268 RepID=A0A813ANS5_9DINO|nr:unnamed protein product [Symbiodinium sp. CCMP2456]CAE7870880.1 unnamed protein product [Symbiodinium necroappetens]